MTLREAKVGVGVIGMLLAAGGVLTGNRIVVWIAIGVLGVALLLRIIDKRSPPPPGDDGGDRAPPPSPVDS